MPRMFQFCEGGEIFFPVEKKRYIFRNFTAPKVTNLLRISDAQLG
jgi:hypothetical protein